MTAVLPATATYQPDLVRHWLATLHGQSAGWVWIGVTTPRCTGRAFPTTNPNWIDVAERHVDQLNQGGAAGIYARTTTLVNQPRRGERGGDDDSHTLPGLAADLDIAGPGHKTVKPLPGDPAAAMAIIDEAGLPDPSIWIHSGGGLYAWWLLDQPHRIMDLPRAKRLCARWQDPIAAAAERLGHSYGRLGDLARILRIPGTVNRKPAMPQPMPCRIIDDTGRRYGIDNLRGALTDALAAMPSPEPVRLPTRATPRRDASGLKPWNDFEARVDWADIIGRHGWTLCYEKSGVRYWTRHGKDRRDGPSATTGKHQRWDRLWVFTDAAPPFDANRLYTKFDAYKLLEHGGDLKTAVRELRRLGYGSRQEAA